MRRVLMAHVGILNANAQMPVELHSKAYQQFSVGYPGFYGFVNPETKSMLVQIFDNAWSRTPIGPEHCCSNLDVFEQCWAGLRQTYGLEKF